MSDDDDLESRSTAFRAEMRDFRAATSSSFDLLRQDVVDLREQLDEGFAKVNEAFVEVFGRLDGAAAGQQRIADMLRTLIDRNH